jgi:hypothetical protein
MTTKKILQGHETASLVLVIAYHMGWSYHEGTTSAANTTPSRTRIAFHEQAIPQYEVSLLQRGVSYTCDEEESHTRYSQNMSLSAIWSEQSGVRRRSC